MSTMAETLRTWARTEVVPDRRIRSAFGILAFALATAFGASVAVPLPFTQVPLTLQTLFVLLAGATLGARAGAGSMALYLAAGAAGAPVFAFGGAGLPWLAGPTGGYLLAMPAAAFVVGAVAGREAGWLRLTAGLALGTLTLYLGGAAQLLLLTGQGPGAVLALGVLPFLAGDLAKLLAAVLLVRSLRWTSLGR